MSANSNTETIGDETRDIEIHLPEDKVNEIFCLLEVPMPDASDLNKVLIHIKHGLGFEAALNARESEV